MYREHQDKTPDVIILDLLSDIYIPVIFSHKLHAEMADLAGGCRSCHHLNPSGPILKCRQCHPISAKRIDLKVPGLKGAYHRQCLGCHREWSHTTKCAVCHSLRSSREKISGSIDSTDIVGTPHPTIPVPEKIFYETRSDQGAFVTFYHDEHIQLFGFLCVDCHRGESCGKCHDMTKPTLIEQVANGKPVKVEKENAEHHAACKMCHEKSKCSKCHARGEKPRYNHLTSTGWNLNRFHEDLPCRKCHENMRFIGPKNKVCTSCHPVWNKDNFDHAVTGLILDETHLENDCSDCHAENKYDAEPVCGNCHEEDFSYPTKKPGKFIKK